MIEWHQHKGDVHGGHRNYKSQKTNGKLKKGWMKMKAKKLLALGFAAIMMVSAMALPASAAEIQPMNNHDDTSLHSLSTTLVVPTPQEEQSRMTQGLTSTLIPCATVDLTSMWTATILTPVTGWIAQTKQLVASLI